MPPPYEDDVTDAGARPGDRPGALRARRLNFEGRLLCACGVLVAGVLLVLAGFFFPYVWSHPRFTRYFTQPCLLKAETGVPCPFCGGTRSTVAAVHGQFAQSLRMSLLGIPVAVACSAVVVWLTLCAVTGWDLGLGALGRMLSRLPMLWLFLGGTGVVWAYKVLADCVFKWNG